MKNLQNLIRFLLAALCLVTISNARAAAPVIVAGTPMATGDEVWVVTLDNGLKKTVTARGLTVGMSPADKAFRIQVAMQLNSVDAQLNGSSVTLRNATDLVHEKNGSLEVTKATTEFNATGAIIDYHGTLSGVDPNGLPSIFQASFGFDGLVVDANLTFGMATGNTIDALLANVFQQFSDDLTGLPLLSNLVLDLANERITFAFPSGQSNYFVQNFTSDISADATMGISTVPEPELLAMLLAGLGLLGIVARRRTKEVP